MHKQEQRLNTQNMCRQPHTQHVAEHELVRGKQMCETARSEHAPLYVFDGVTDALFLCEYLHKLWWVVGVSFSFCIFLFFFFSSRRRHTRLQGDWSSDVCSSDLGDEVAGAIRALPQINDPGTLGQTVRELYRSQGGKEHGHENRFRVLCEALPL